LSEWTGKCKVSAWIRYFGSEGCICRMKLMKTTCTVHWWS